MKNNQIVNYEINESDGVITFKNKNTTVGFIRFNNKGEVSTFLLIQHLENKV